MKNDKSGFWKAICKDPDDDVPRLVFADYLDEQGHPERAELIRAQCDLEALPISDPRRIDLEMTSRWLLQEYQHQWNEELPKWGGVKSITFRRGFPYAIGVTPATFARRSGVITRKTAIQHLSFDHQVKPDDVGDIEESGFLSRARSFRFTSAPYAFCRCMLREISLLKELEIVRAGDHDTNVVGAFLDTLQEADLTKLTQLNLAFHAGFAPTRMIEIALDADVPMLKHLTVEMIDLSGDAHVVLLVHPRMHQIESLVLKRSFPVHVKDLLADLTELRCLELTLDPTRDEHDVVDYLIPLNDLTRLSMNGVNNQIAYALASSPVLGRVRDLEITVSSTATTTFLSDRALRSIVESDNAKHLARLRVRGRVDMKMYLALMENANLPSLRHLDLPNSDLREQDLVALMDCKSLPELKSISFCASNDDLFREWKTRFIDRAHLLRSW